MTAPLTPEDCNLQDFAFMPLDVARLRDSDLAANESPEACWAAVQLWAASWHQVPAASIPNDDKWMAKATGYGRGVKEWLRVRDGALRGFVLCSDGRLYHAVVAEKACEAWQSKVEQRYRTEVARVKKHNQRHGTAFIVPEFDAWVSLGRPSGHHLNVPGDNQPQHRDSNGDIASKRKGEGQGQGQREGQGQGDLNTISARPAEAVQPPAVKPTKPAKPKAEASESATAPTWAAYAQAYADAYGTEPVRNAKVNGQLTQLIKRLGADESPGVAAFFLSHKNMLYVRAMHPVDLLLRDAEKLRTEWATNRQVTSTQAAQADRTQSNFNAFAPMLAEAQAKKQEETHAFS